MTKHLQVEKPAATAQLSMVASSAQKCRLAADLVRGKSLEEAHRNLILEPKKAAKVILKLIKSAMANAQQKGVVDLDRLYVSEIQVGEGPRMRRLLTRAQGRADRILKRTSHIYLALSEKKSAAPKARAKGTSKTATKAKVESK
jgi:large subunit ribosomal protein L22